MLILGYIHSMKSLWVSLFAIILSFNLYAVEEKTMQVSSTFAANTQIQKAYTGEGADESLPLNIDEIPPNTKSLAIIMDDPDAPVGTFVHWVLWNYPVSGPSLTLPQGLPKTGRLSNGSQQGTNDFGRQGYNGPMPPRRHGIHHYHIKVYALDTLLAIPAGSRKADLERAMKGHILAQAELIGLYERK